MSIKVKIKIGQVEIEYEGPEEFLKSEMPKILQEVQKLHALPEMEPSDGGSGAGGFGQSHGQGGITGTTGAIAAKLKASSGPDLIIAAAAKLSFVDKLDHIPRKMFLDEMKSATGYYKATYRANLSGYLERLVKS